MRQHRKILKRFFERYGTQVENTKTGQKTKGILMPAKNLNMDREQVKFQTVGFSPKREYVLLVADKSAEVMVKSQLLIDNHIYYVTSLEEATLSEEMLYCRVYLTKIRQEVTHD